MRHWLRVTCLSASSLCCRRPPSPKEVQGAGSEAELVKEAAHPRRLSLTSLAGWSREPRRTSR